MTSLKQIQQSIKTLPPEALELIEQFINLLSKIYPVSIPQTADPEISAEDSGETSVYERFQNSGLIGCMSEDEDLSTTYKEVLAKEWGEKYDHR